MRREVQKQTGLGWRQIYKWAFDQGFRLHYNKRRRITKTIFTITKVPRKSTDSTI